MKIKATTFQEVNISLKEVAVQYVKSHKNVVVRDGGYYLEHVYKLGRDEEVGYYQTSKEYYDLMNSLHDIIDILNRNPDLDK